MNDRSKTLLLGLAAAAALSLAATAAEAVTVDFSVSLGNGAPSAGSIAGYLTGLSDNATGAATGFYLTSVSPSLGTGGWGLNQDLLATANVFANSVTITAGVVTALDIFFAGPDSSVYGQAVQLDHYNPPYPDYDIPAAYGSEFRNVSVTYYDTRSAPIVTATVRSEAVTDAPEPASFLLLGSALIGFAARRRCHA